MAEYTHDVDFATVKSVLAAFEPVRLKGKADAQLLKERFHLEDP